MNCIIKHKNLDSTPQLLEVTGLVAHACACDAIQDVARAQSEEPGPSGAALEGPVLMAINVERSQQGLDIAHKLTVQLLKAHLKGKFIGGQEWKAGNKKKEDLTYDYR